MRTIRTDCLVIGAGLAGSAYALHVAQLGYSVELLSLAEPLAANSDWAQGGIIYDPTETTATGSLAQDIQSASDHTSNPAAVAQLIHEGPAAVKELLLDELHVDFDRSAAGELLDVVDAEHAVDESAYAGPQAGGSIAPAADGGGPSRVDNLLPREQDAVRRFFK